MSVLNPAKIFHTKLNCDSLIIREMILNALYATGGGHYGGALSVVDILFVLYENILNISPAIDESLVQDSLILSKGHAAIALYCVLAKKGFFPPEQLTGYGKFNKGLEGHPDMNVTSGIDFSSGSLGQGLSVGMGMALAKKNNAHVWVVLGDGECQEGQVWEAALLAARYNVCNLHAVIDYNGAQECGYKYDKSLPQEPIQNIEEKWRAFGWDVQIVDGHDVIALNDAFVAATKTLHKPSVVIANTKKGHGVPMFEKDPEYFHCITLTMEQHLTAIEELKHATTW